MLSFDISDRQINIVKGDNTANKIRIEKSLVVTIPDDEDMILNGEVVNLSGLAELITTNLKAEMMTDKEAIVTFSSSNIVFKELVVPKAKGDQFLNMVQNSMSHEMGISDDYSISYTVVGEAGEDQPGAVKVLATACPSTIVESYRKLFNILSINLKSVNIGCNSISRIVLADKSNIEKMPLLVCQLDKNFLGLTLFENGQMAFARYVPITEEDYESEDYVLEALNENIFKMEQFNKARGGPGLENVILYGVIEDYIKIVDALDGLDIKASVLGVPSQITGFENFEFTVFANAIGALYKRNKATERINLLEVDQSTGKGGAGLNSLFMTAGIIVAVSLVAVFAIRLIVGIRTTSLENDIKDTETEIAEYNDVLAENTILKLQDKAVLAYKDAVEQSIDNFKTWPLLDKEVFDKIDEALEEADAEYTGFNYAIEGTVEISGVTVKTEDDATKLIESLKALDYFANVSFDGFTKVDDSTVDLGSLTLSLKEEEVAAE